MAWKLTIEKIKNGYICKGIGDDRDLCEEWVIQNSEVDPLKSIEELTWDMWEFFAYFGSKHDKERLFLNREVQHGKKV